MKLSTPRVSPSASPRNSENEPRVTIKAGMRRRVTSNPFSPPASAPTARVKAAAAPIGKPTSRVNLPNSTADSPISDPTDRSMPPLTITGVNATARRPISTLRRTTSKALFRVAKLVPIAAKTAPSSRSKTRRMRCAGSSQRRRSRVGSVRESDADIVEKVSRVHRVADSGVRISPHVRAEHKARPRRNRGSSRNWRTEAATVTILSLGGFSGGGALWQSGV